MGSLYHRLDVWVFIMEYKDDSIYMQNQFKQMGEIFTFLEGNEIMFKILGMALAVGNIMNGGTPKGQSDGFELSVLNKLGGTKDNSGKSALAFIMSQLAKDDEDLVQSWKDQIKIFSSKATDLDALKGKFNATNGRYSDANTSHRAVTESGEDADNFCKETGL